MCGRYTQTKGPDDIRLQLDIDDFLHEITPRYNIAPGQQAPVIINDGRRMSLRLMQWGLVPSWAKDPAIGNKMINARAETLTEKPSFKGLIRQRRCLIVADGFYEWTGMNREKIPVRFVLKTRESFTFAGLWDIWKKTEGGKLQSFTIITTNANNVVRLFHERMPVILKKEDERPWLDPDLKDPAILVSLLKPYPEKRMESYPVSKLVNSPFYEGPECIRPVAIPKW